MFNFLYKLGSLYFTKPSLHNVQPKSLNVYFKHSVDKKYSFVNLSDCSALDLEVTVNKEDQDNKYRLVINKESFDGYKTQHCVAIFESRERAYEALEILKVKMFSPEKSLIKFSIVAFAVVFLWGVLLDIVLLNTQKMGSVVGGSAQQVGQAPQLPTNNELNAVLSQIQAGQPIVGVQPQAPVEDQPPVPAAPPLAIPQPSGNPNVDNFLQGLQK